jgi:hypothetical protein
MDYSIRILPCFPLILFFDYEMIYKITALIDNYRNKR